MNLASELDHPVLTCHVLEKKPRTDAEDSSDHSQSSLLSESEDTTGYTAQLEAYHLAWKRCLSRVQTIVTELQAPIVSAVKTNVDNAYSHDVLPGLPHAELPVIVVSVPGGGRSAISAVVEKLEAAERLKAKTSSTNGKKGKQRMTDDVDEKVDTPVLSLVAHVNPAGCTSIMATMKAIVTGFVDRRDNGTSEGLIQLPPPIKRKATSSLANFDISLLRIWYKALAEVNDRPVHLVVVLHDFEEFDPSVMQQTFYICSKSIPQLPLVFLVDSSAPSFMAYLHAAYPRAAIALLRVHVHAPPSGTDLVNTIVENTFFNPDFESEISLGPGTLDFLSEFSSRFTMSLDTVLTILQIAYMKHFEEPLTAFVNGFGSISDIQEAAQLLKTSSSFTLVETLMFRIWGEASPEARRMSEREVPDYLEGLDWGSPTIEDLLTVVDKAHQEIRHSASHMRLAFSVFKCVQKFMHAQGYKTTTSPTGQDEDDLSFMTRFMRARVSRDVKHLSLMIKKLPDTLLDAILSKLYSLFYALQSRELRQEEAEAREFIVRSRNSIPKEVTVGDEGQKKASTVSPAVSDWFTSYIESRVTRLDQKLLGELWHTGATPFPSELVNPAVRPAIVNALLHPHDVINAHRELFPDDAPSQPDDEPSGPSALWDLPDTSILFRRYMEAGRMINVYDLFQSFASVLDAQKEHFGNDQPRSESTPPKHAAGKGKQRAVADEADEGEPSDDEEERWQLELHARFIRAFQELDYMGFFKQTTRKADHILRTIYDIID